MHRLWFAVLGIRHKSKVFVEPDIVAFHGELFRDAYVPSRNGSPAWDYEFACLVAADVSDGTTLKQSWEKLPAVVKKGFWEGANIYVMIVRGAVKTVETGLDAGTAASANLLDIKRRGFVAGRDAATPMNAQDVANQPIWVQSLS
jgi:hypothetical protein